MAIDITLSADQSALIEALAVRGITAVENQLKGDLQGLEIVLLPDDGSEKLSILAGCIIADCEIGISGFRREGDSRIDCASAELVITRTTDQAADAVEKFWLDRDTLIADFRRGAYDLR